MIASLVKRLTGSAKPGRGGRPSVAFGVLIAIIGVVILSPWIAPHDPTAVQLETRLLPPFWMEGGDLKHLFGTDHLGRDIFSRVLVGGRSSLSVAALAVILAGSIGIALGVLAGYYGGLVDALIMRLTDAASAVPIILIALLFVITLGPSFLNVVLALGALLWARYPRVVRSEVLAVRSREYVVLAKLAAVPNRWIIYRHILPTIAHAAIVLLTLQLGIAIILEATLSFLGAGVPPPAPSWGAIVADGRNYIATAWWISVFPGFAIALVVLCCNRVGDWLRDRFDPHLTTED